VIVANIRTEHAAQPSSSTIITWSKHSLRIEPITRSTYALCQGDLGARKNQPLITERILAKHKGVLRQNRIRTLKEENQAISLATAVRLNDPRRTYRGAGGLGISSWTT
jgi:hypothetical protein